MSPDDNVAHLETHLSQYLAEVRRGQTVIVYDRSTPIARLVPYEPERPMTDLRAIRGVKPRRPVDIVRLLRESREPP